MKTAIAVENMTVLAIAAEIMEEKAQEFPIFSELFPEDFQQEVYTAVLLAVRRGKTMSRISRFVVTQLKNARFKTMGCSQCPLHDGCRSKRKDTQ